MSLGGLDRTNLEWGILFVCVGYFSGTSPSLAQSTQTSHAEIWGPMFTSQVERCWKKPKPSADAAKVEAVFSIKLTRDGKLEGIPVPEKAPTTPYLRLLQESGLRALVACQPYQLQADYFEEWKHFAPEFTDLDSLMW